MGELFGIGNLFKLTADHIVATKQIVDREQCYRVQEYNAEPAPPAPPRPGGRRTAEDGGEMEEGLQVGTFFRNLSTYIGCFLPKTRMSRLGS
jgi:hypothetical protein